MQGWTRRLPAIPGELLSSCLCRNAFAHGLPPYRFLNLLWERDPVWNRDFDRNPSSLSRVDRVPGAQPWTADIANQLGVPTQAIVDATLEGWLAMLGTDVTAAAADSRLVLSAGVLHRTRTRHAMQYCPECLCAGVPHFRKAWRLGFVAWCHEHSRALRDACPHCDAPVIPHRSMSTRISDCHRCGRDIADRGREGHPLEISTAAIQLQRRLLDILSCRGDGARNRGGRGTGHPLCLSVRALLSASAPSSVHARLRAGLGLAPVVSEGVDRRRFEHARIAVRAPWLETVATWMGDWPRNFLVGADAIGATGRTFARCHVSPALADQIARLPTRRKPPRKPWEPLLDEPAINRLRRTDRTAYHALRGSRIMARLPPEPTRRADRRSPSGKAETRP